MKTVSIEASKLAALLDAAQVAAGALRELHQDDEAAALSEAIEDLEPISEGVSV